jgi:hypothetical protein
MQSGASAHPLAPSGKKLLIGKLLPTLSRRGNEVVITQRAFGPTKFIPLMAAFNAIALMVAKPHSLASVRCQGARFLLGFGQFVGHVGYFARFGPPPSLGVGGCLTTGCVCADLSGAQRSDRMRPTDSAERARKGKLHHGNNRDGQQGGQRGTSNEPET